MILSAYDYLLISGILIGLILLFTQLKILKGTLLGKATIGFGLKFVAMFGALFLVTALIGGSALAGFTTKNALASGMATVSNKVETNKENTIALKQTVSQLKENLHKAQLDDPSEEKEASLRTIHLLEYRIQRLSDDNEELDENLNDLKRQLDHFYALVPGSFY